MKKIPRQYRQGDVLLQPIDSIPQTAKPRKGKVVTLAEGELTGHSHTITAPRRRLETYESEGVLYLLVKQPVTLEHQEHGGIVVDPGAYMVRRQTEMWMDEVRQVAD